MVGNVASQIHKVQAGNVLDRQKGNVAGVETPTSDHPRLRISLAPTFQPAANAAAIRSRPALRKRTPFWLAGRSWKKNRRTWVKISSQNIPKSGSTREFSGDPMILWDPKMNNAMANTLPWTGIGMDRKNSRSR